MSEIAVGFDLATTMCVCAVWKDGKPEIVTNQDGDRQTPSWIAFTENERLVGSAAKSQVINNINNTVFDIKRIIGRKFSDPGVQEDIKHFPFKVIAGQGDKPLICIKYKGENKQFTCEEISAMLLSKMKEDAENFLGKPVKKCVVSVPAYFNNDQRQASKDAALIAGLDVLRIVNEPTCAVLAYGFDKTFKMGEKVLMCVDPGCGTTDISILTLSEGLFEVRAISGNSRLGGEDIDNRLTEYCVQEFKRKHKIDISNNQRSVRRLKTACERAKRNLSSATQALIEIDSLYEGVDFNLTLTRAKFDELCVDFFKKIVDLIDQAMRDAKLSKSQIDEVILVGGTSRIPKIQQLIQEYFNGKELNKSVNPDEAIAIGACIQAEILINGDKNEQLKDILLLDVNPLSLGVEVNGCMMEPLIPRNTTIPAKKTKTFSNAGDNQTEVKINVFEGERQMTKDNNKIGEFRLTIPPMPRGTAQIEISFDLDANSILNVTAVEKSTGKSNKIEIKNDRNKFTQEQINKLVKEAEEMRDSDKKIREQIESRNQLESYIYSVKSTLKEMKDKKPEVEELLKKVESIQEEVDNNKFMDKDTCLQRQKEIEVLFLPLVQGTKATTVDDLD